MPSLFTAPCLSKPTKIARQVNGRIEGITNVLLLAFVFHLFLQLCVSQNQGFLRVLLWKYCICLFVYLFSAFSSCPFMWSPNILMLVEIEAARFWSTSNSPYSLTRNTTSHLGFSQLIHWWKIIILTNSHYPTCTVLFERLREWTFWTWEWRDCRVRHALPSWNCISLIIQLVQKKACMSIVNWHFKLALYPFFIQGRVHHTPWVRCDKLGGWSKCQTYESIDENHSL